LWTVLVIGCAVRARPSRREHSMRTRLLLAPGVLFATLFLHRGRNGSTANRMVRVHSSHTWPGPHFIFERVTTVPDGFAYVHSRGGLGARNLRVRHGFAMSLQPLNFVASKLPAENSVVIIGCRRSAAAWAIGSWNELFKPGSSQAEWTVSCDSGSFSQSRPRPGTRHHTRTLGSF
jgi:hypothetical protein